MPYSGGGGIQQLQVVPVSLSRGFGSVGTGSTDMITTGLTTYPVQRSWLFWVYQVGLGGNSLGRVFDQGSTVGNRFLVLSGTEWEFDYLWNGGGGSWSIVAPSTNAWHSVGITYDNSSTANVPVIYLDGVSVTVTQLVAPGGSITSGVGLPIAIGNRTSDTARNWDGRIAEFAVWDRILSGAEMANQRVTLISNANLVCYLPMVGQSPEPDKSGNNNNGVLSGTTVLKGPF